ncbi:MULTISPECIES: PaaI family thioesterase [Flavobacteriaceae]|jgi:uncharacterized protein (TIGR00369 family)|uniref:PaaI family thioesterase n=5 Tax=Flavobacteriaceae TaxID=49546 RepID=A0ABU7IYX3_9FLAO|nr:MULTISPECIES: PaaI family thioesterase [Flavobacteriaceae]MAO15624.1 hypothetical protein [Allomuricauda sp.]RUA17265.1 MAG: PaaI family thioesterase [Flavobacteriia bacterium]MBW8245222.1 PaaI family thioesterase [Allomuricauda oceani]MDC6390805.1 PaaI family thioesterase [Maribacter sp. PR1]MEE1978197.1 PaaI family thioesterase [Maribacter cobaltidurans]|tara:strand:- start:1312 stop:1752 length:441 start_codon:yes stop_codon:yes gene_type:complete
MQEIGQDDYLFLKHAIENMMPANKIFGLEIMEIRLGYVCIKVPFKKEFIGDYLQKRWHGGILAAMADTAGGAAGATTLDSLQDRINTLDMRIDYLHPTVEGDILAKAKIVKSGKSINVVDVELFQSGQKDLVALARCIYSIHRNGS